MTTAIVDAATEIAPPPPTPETIKVSDLKAGAFAKVKADFTNPTDAIEILNYIDFLAQNNSISADELSIPAPKDKKWTLTRSEATALFFGHIESRSEEIKKSIVLPDKKAQDALIAAMNSRAAEGKRRVEASIKEKRTNARDHLETANNRLAEARMLEEEVEGLTGMDQTARIRAIMDALPSLNWNFHKFASNKIEFVSRADIMLRHIDKKAGLHYELNCGKFRLEIDLARMTPRLLAYQRCVPPMVDNRIHPHVSSSEICFGNGAHTAADAQAKGDIVALLKLLDSMLPNYGDQPFIRIDNFKKNLEERDRLERENHGKKEKGEAPEMDADQDILDDEPEFTDDIDWTGGDDE